MKTRYVLEVYDTTGEHRPVARFESETPFHTVAAGDRFDDIGWNRLNGVGVLGSTAKPKRYVVHSIKHLIYQSGSEVVVEYCLNLSPFSGPSSPVWSNE